MKKKSNFTKKVSKEGKMVIADYSRTASLEFSDSAIKHQQKESKIALNNLIRNAYVIHYVDQGYSGLNFNRPAFKKMLNAIKKGKIDGIIVSDFDRVTRNVFDLDYFVTEVLEPRKIQLYSASQKKSYITLRNEFISGEMEEIYNSYYKSVQNKSRKISTKFLKKSAKGGK